MTMSRAPSPSRVRRVRPLALRHRLEQNRATSALFDTPRLVASLETLFDRMWEEFRAGELPVPNLTNLAGYEEIGLDLLLGREGESIPPDAYHAELARWNEAEPLAARWQAVGRASGHGGLLALTRAA